MYFGCLNRYTSISRRPILCNNKLREYDENEIKEDSAFVTIIFYADNDFL